MGWDIARLVLVVIIIATSGFLTYLREPLGFWAFAALAFGALMYALHPFSSRCGR